MSETGMPDHITCEFCEHDFPAPLGRYGCPNCLGTGVGAVDAQCSVCDKVCDPDTCAMPACPHKPEEPTA